MKAARSTLRLIDPSAPSDRTLAVLLLAACAAVDAAAVGTLLLDTPLPPSLEVFAAAVLHGTAVLFLSGLALGRPSHWWLCASAVLAVPGAGAAVAAVVLVTRGRNSAALERRRKARRRPELSKVAMQRLADSLSPCDALECGDETARRAALTSLSRREDPEAIAVLLRAAGGRDPELALSAALVLDEIGERAERRMRRLELAEVRHAVG